MDAGPGRVSVNWNLNYLLDKSSTELQGIFAMVDYTGTLGPNQNGLNGNSYEWRTLTSIGYYWGDLNLTLRHDYRSSIEQAVVAQGLPGNSGAPGYHLFDLLGNYAFTDNLWLRFGIENLFNEEPPVIGVNENDPNGMYGGFVADAGFGGSRDLRHRWPSFLPGRTRELRIGFVSVLKVSVIENP